MINIQKFCPVCLFKPSKKYFLASSDTYKDSKNIELKVNICDHCKSFYLKEFIEESKIDEYYPKSYYTKENKLDTESFNFKVRECSYSFFKGYPLKKSLTFKLLFFSIAYSIFFWHRFGRFPNHLKDTSNPSMLEIGYGGGNYLLDLKNLGWHCYGVDVDQFNATQLIEKGILVADKFEKLDFDKNKLDYIYSYHAFEHIYDIDSAMKNSFNLLSEKGIFKLCVPMSDGLLPRIFKRYWYDLGVPIHKQIYSYIGVQALAKRHGFKISKYKYNSYAESLAGSILALLLSIFKYKKKSAQDLAGSKFFKLICLILSPIVLFLDVVKLGDRAEFVLVKN